MKKWFSHIFKVPMLLVLLFVVLIYGFPALGKDAEVDEFAIVTAIGLDRGENDEVDLSLLTFMPVAEQNFKENYKVVKASGKSVLEAMDYAGLYLGREIGLNHVKMVVINEDYFTENASVEMDYLVRDKSLALSTSIICTDAKASECLDAVQKMDSSSSIKVDDIITFNNKYIYSTESTFESFYKGLYSKTKSSLVSFISLVDNADEGLSADSSGGQSQNGQGGQSSGGSGQSQNGSQGGQPNGQSQSSKGGQKAQKEQGEANKSSQNAEQSQNGEQSQNSSQGGGGGSQGGALINDGKSILCKNAQMVASLSNDDMKNINLASGAFKKGTIVIENFSDDVFKNARLTFDIQNISVRRKVQFKNGQPIVNLSLKLYVKLLEAKEEDLEIKENIDIKNISKKAIDALTEKVKSSIADGINLLREYRCDILKIYTLLNNSHPFETKKFMKSLEDEGDFLSSVIFKVSPRIYSV